MYLKNVYVLFKKKNYLLKLFWDGLLGILFVQSLGKCLVMFWPIWKRFYILGWSFFYWQKIALHSYHLRLPVDESKILPILWLDYAGMPEPSISSVAIINRHHLHIPHKVYNILGLPYCVWFFVLFPYFLGTERSGWNTVQIFFCRSNCWQLRAQIYLFSNGIASPTHSHKVLPSFCR